MTIVSIDDVIGPIDRCLRKVGFRARSKRTWDRPTVGVVQVVHLDRSSYGPQNRLEVFLGLKEMVDPKKYKLSDFDVVVRFGRIVERKSDLAEALDQENVGMTSDIRGFIIVEQIEQSLIPLLVVAIDREGLCKLRQLMPSKNDLFIGPRTESALSH